MPNYLICYDVRSKNHDYKALYACLAQWNAAHLQNSVWLAELKGPCTVVRDILRGHMHADDTVAVVQLPSNGAPSDWATKHDRVTGVNWLRSHYG
jgi:CRISPR/Cas system-associated endoribonuclease Cas2